MFGHYHNVSSSNRCVVYRTRYEGHLVAHSLMKKLTQRENILQVLRDVNDGTHTVPNEYLRQTPEGLWLSSRYLKQIMLISEANGRISEARTDGYDIATLEGVKDPYGFAYHRLVAGIIKQIKKANGGKMPEPMCLVVPVEKRAPITRRGKTK